MDGDDGLSKVATLSEQNDPMFQVFNNGLLRDIILEKAIEGIQGDYSKPQIFNCRLVSKEFLGSISRILKRLPYSMKTLNLCRALVEDDDDLDVQRDENEEEDKLEELENMKNLEATINVFSSSDRLAAISTLPFALYVGANEKFLMSDECRDFVLSFLTTDICSSSLIEFKIWFPETMDMNFPKGNHDIMFSFPTLHGFHVQQFGKSDSELDNKKFTLIQQVLNGAENLRVFQLRNYPYKPIPEKVTNLLKLPKNLTKLQLVAKLSSLQLQQVILTRNSLPKLKSLEISIQGPVSKTDVQIFEKIFEKFQETLTALVMNGKNDFFTPVPVGSVNIHIPVMKKLSYLEIVYVLPWSWASAKKTTSLTECFPVLKTLHFFRLNDAAWFNFLDGGDYGSVIEFETKGRPLYGEAMVPFQINGNLIYHGNLTLLQVSRIGEVFQNLQSLEAPLDQNGLAVVFQEMRQLKKLIVDAKLNRLTSDRLQWKLALLGITVEEDNRIKKIPQKDWYWNGPRAVQLRREEGAVSILDMSELTHLKLSSAFTPKMLGYGLLTPTVFYLGFMKMAKLKNLELYGCFKPTQQMIKKWTANHGGTISYTYYSYEEESDDGDNGNEVDSDDGDNGNEEDSDDGDNGNVEDSGHDDNV